ncbi:MAG: glycosyltransferase [Pseudomonadota bacterium]
MTKRGVTAAQARPRLSVIALTRDRPKEFRSLLQALALQRMTDFEVIVVGAKPTVEDHGAPPGLARRITYAQCRAQNISRSRNIGLALATGDIVAFTDDDAAPEPGWLEAIEDAFHADDIGAVGGYVRGRNGVDFQWRGVLVDRYGGHAPATPERIAAMEIDEATEFFPTTVGVNSAFSRKALTEIDGFDDNFHYFLDESDVCLRLQMAGWRVLLAPKAEVHHAYAASAMRHPNRAPRDLFQIAASRAYFSRRYGRADWIERKIEDFAADQTARLTKFVQLGRLSRRQAREIAERMAEGLIEGERRFETGPALGRGGDPERMTRAADRFRPEGAERRPRVALAVGGLARRGVARAARRLAERGCEVTVIDFELGAKRLKVWFEDGIWRHMGGVLGRDRFGDALPAPRRHLRVQRELARIADQRDFDVILRPASLRYRIGDLRPVRLQGSLRGFVAEPMRSGGARAVVEMLAR